MNLTAAEQATLKADVQAKFSAQAALDDWPAISVAYNQPSVPAVNVWRNDITPSEVASAITMAAFTGLSQQQQNGLLLLTQDRVDATSSNVRLAFNTIFGAGATLTALTALAQRVGTRAEILFSSGASGANVSSKLGQILTADDVQKAMLS